MRYIEKSTGVECFNNFVRRNHPTTWDELHENAKEVYFESREHILVIEQNCYCGYTEIIINDVTNSHIDHYKKRSLFPRETYKWNNLIVSCNDDEFGAKYKDNKSHMTINDYDNLLNPVIDIAQDYFYYNNFGQIEPKQDLDIETRNKANKTIESFNLSNESLRRKRENIIRQINDCKDLLPIETLKGVFKKVSFQSLVEQYLEI